MYELSETQKEIIGHGEGPALVLAGPGSGKTTVIASRAVRLEKECAKPEEIMTLCFGREAASEMSRRYLKYRCENGTRKAVFSTVHSICYRILSDNSHGMIKVIEGRELASVLNALYMKENKGKKTDIEQLVNAISRQRNISEYGKKIVPQIYGFHEICEGYERYKRENGLLDYDDMIFYALELLENSAKVRRRYSKRFIQADEAQDLSEAQFRIIRLLAPEGNVFTVADDDQSIYGFRGAAPECIIKYTETFPDAKIFRLGENHRSTKNIVRFASAVAERNEVRCDKTIFTNKENGDDVEIICFQNAFLQSRFILKYIKETKKDDKNKTVGVLYRNNISALLLSVMLIRNGVDFRISGDFPAVGNHFMVKAFLNELKKAERKRLIVPSPADVLKKMKSEGFTEASLLNCEITGKQKRTVYAMLDFLEGLSSSCRSYEECLKMTESIEGVKEKADGSCTVFLSTVHSAKGLEYDTVFVTDVVKDEFPGKGAYSGQLLEEERRLFYVAVTRAKEKLFITYPEKRGGTYEEKSIFIKEAEEKPY